MRYELSPYSVFLVDIRAMQVAQLCQGIRYHFLNKTPGIRRFFSSECEKDTIRFKQWLHSILDTRRNFSEQLVRAAIKNSCVGYAANAICCLPPGTTLDDITAKFNWLYRSAESFNTPMQECYRIMQGKSKGVQPFVLHLEQALKLI